MELFLWLWVWDRRLLCGLLHGRARFIYLWLIPFFISITLLPYAGLIQYRAIQSEASCDQFSEVKEEGETLRYYIYIEEGILSLSILASLAMIFNTKSIYNKITKTSKPVSKEQGKNQYLFEETPWADYTFWVRNDSILSVFGFFTVIIALSNYIFSIIFVRQYLMYNSTIEQHSDLDSNKCEVPSAWVIVCYCSILQVPLGSLAILIYFITILCKGLPAIGFLIPFSRHRAEKCLMGIPAEDFARIAEELSEMAEVVSDETDEEEGPQAPGQSLLNNWTVKSGKYGTNISQGSRDSLIERNSLAKRTQAVPVPTLETNSNVLANQERGSQTSRLIQPED